MFVCAPVLISCVMQVYSASFDMVDHERLPSIVSEREKQYTPTTRATPVPSLALHGDDRRCCECDSLRLYIRGMLGGIELRRSHEFDSSSLSVHVLPLSLTALLALL